MHAWTVLSHHDYESCQQIVYAKWFWLLWEYLQAKDCFEQFDTLRRRTLEDVRDYTVRQLESKKRLLASTVVELSTERELISIKP